MNTCKKCFKIYIMLVEKNFNYRPISKFKIIHTIFQEAVVKSCENLFCNKNCIAKVKVELHIND